MRAVLQRVLSASVIVDGEVVGAIDEPGLLVHLGVTHDDGDREIAWTAGKTTPDFRRLPYAVMAELVDALA